MKRLLEYYGRDKEKGREPAYKEFIYLISPAIVGDWGLLLRGALALDNIGWKSKVAKIGV